MKRTPIGMLALLLILALLAGCSSKSTDQVTEEFAWNAAATDMEAPGETYAAAPAATGGNLSLESNSANGSTTIPQADVNRKLIKNVWLTAETEDFDGLMAGVTSRISQLGGYVENQEAYYGSAYRNSGSCRADLTIRIPADQLANFVSQVSEISNVTSSRESAEDVTLSYADTESRKKALETEQDRLLELMEQAETTEDLLAIESRLTDVRYQLESAASQLKLYDSLVSYSTVYLTVEEVQKLTPGQELSTWGKITTGFRENLQTLGDGLLGLLVFLTAGLPYWIPLALLALLCSFLIRRHRRKKQAAQPPQENRSHTAPPEA